MLRAAIAGLVLAASSIAVSGAALAQWGWAQPYDDTLYRPYPYQYRNPTYQPPPGQDLFWGDSQRPKRPPPESYARPSWGSMSGGPRPAIAPIAPGRIWFPSAYPVGSIVIDHRGRQLFLVLSHASALRYPISVGREGFGWTGSQRISRVVDWPDWTPPASMRARDPRLPAHMTGGLRNPLGVKALYLGNTLYRIHGTNNAASIGRASSSGCFRMLNGHVVDLARRAGVGTLVKVVRRLPPSLERIVAEQVAWAPRVKPATAAKAPRVVVPKALAPRVVVPKAFKPSTAVPAVQVPEPEPEQDAPLPKGGPAGEGGGARQQPS